ncbi:TolC family protein [Daejeonella sp.]|uniref:TolC family protein n=1 Tax=Daejeonella sp. TaxID=2805397 RepID=UPI0025B83BED|nr:TolC family protein [Daejeonella sp.]
MSSRLAIGQDKMSLEQIFEEIKSKNIGLKSYASRIQSKDAKVEGASAWMAPMVGAGTFMTPYPFQGMAGENDRGALMLTAEQEIPNPAKVKAKREYLQIQSKGDIYAQSELFNQFKARARQLYFGLLIDYKRIYYQEENKRIMETMMKLAEIRYPFNQGGLNQVFKAEGRAFESENMILMTKSSIRSKKITLNTLMNRSAEMDLQIDTSFQVNFIPKADLDTAYFASSRSDILNMQHEINVMKKNINLMKQEAKPDFRLRFDHMSNYSAMMPRQFTVMGMLSIPIVPWSSKMYKSEIKSMNFEQEAMRQQKAAMLTDMLGMTRSMESELTLMQKQLANYEQRIVPSLQKYLKVSILSYQENKSDLNTVIDAWEALNMAQMNYLNQLEKFYQMIVDYEKNIER